MKKNELQTILGYLNIGLAIAHNIGISAGHFGSTDFIQLAQAVNSLLLEAVAPASSTPAAPASTATVSAPANAAVATVTVASVPVASVPAASGAVTSGAVAN